MRGEKKSYLAREKEEGKPVTPKVRNSNNNNLWGFGFSLLEKERNTGSRKKKK